MKRILIIFFVVLLAFAANAMIINIPEDYSAIQDGINQATDGDTILVQPGTYVENIDYSGKNITVGSLFLTTQDSAFIYQTVMDGNQDGSVVSFKSGEDTTAILSGFTIMNGLGYNGGGICCSTACPTLTNLRVTSNASTAGEQGGGGGIFCGYSDAILRDIWVSNNTSIYNGRNSNRDEEVRGLPMYCGGGICIIGYSDAQLSNVTVEGNSGEWGGGIFCGYLCDPVMDNIVMRYNTAAFGSGMCVTENCDPVLNNAKVSQNSGGWGGLFFLDDCNGIVQNSTISGNVTSGIRVNSSAPTLINNVIANNASRGITCVGAQPMSITNCTIVGNASTDAGGIMITGDNLISIKNCILWNHNPVQLCTSLSPVEISYCNIQYGEDGISGNGNYTYENNIDVDPLFVDIENEDFHLLHASPCIDAGNPQSDYSNEPEPNGGRINMGAYGNTEEATVSTGIIYIPDMEATSYEFAVPIINEFSTVEPVNIHLNLSYDEDILDFLGYSSEGTQLETWTIVAEETNPGEITISAFSTNMLNMDSNRLLNLEFTSLTNNISTDIDFESASFGDILRNTQGGTITITYTKIDQNFIINIPENFALYGNYPNPFNPTTTITFGMPQKAEVGLNIYDISGKLIKTLVDKSMEAGYHSVIWDGKNENGKISPSGIYLYTIETKNFMETRSMILIQ